MSTLKKIKRLLANRGGIGASLSREETIERLNPLVRRHMEMNYAYAAAARRHSDDDLTTELRRQQKIARADVGKLRETVLSMGGVADNGVDMEPSDFATDSDERSLIEDLRDRERKLLDAVKAELDLDLPEHQWRTIAILENVRDHSKQRLDFIKNEARSSRQDASLSERDEALPSEKQAAAAAAVVSGKEPEALEVEPERRPYGKEYDRAPSTSEAETPPDADTVATDPDPKDDTERAKGTEEEVSDPPEDEQQAPDEQTDELRENPPGGADEAQNETDVSKTKKKGDDA